MCIIYIPNQRGRHRYSIHLLYINIYVYNHLRRLTVRDEHTVNLYSRVCILYRITRVVKHLHHNSMEKIILNFKYT